VNETAASPRAGSQLVLLAGAMILGMTPWFSATVASPGMIAEWGTESTTSAWLTIAVQVGFVIGTFLSAVLLLSDRFSARRLAATSSLVAAVATALLVWRHTGPTAAIALRGITGIALAGVYPPGIKIAAGWWQTHRGMAIGVLVGALTIGSAAPNLFHLAASSSDWRPMIIAASVAAIASAGVFGFVVTEGPYQAPSAPFDPHALSSVVRDRGVMLATAGYLGHMWELYAMWSSIGAFWSYVVVQHAMSPTFAPVLAFVTIAAGTAGCIVAGIVADRVGRAVVTMISMAVSGTCALVIGFLTNAPFAALVAVAVVWGVSIVADSAQFSAAVTELAPSRYVGTAITLQTCVGFLLTIVTIRLIPVWVGLWGWERAYMPLAIGPALGILAMWRLSRMPIVSRNRE
jgi:MFS family permease